MAEWQLLLSDPGSNPAASGLRFKSNVFQITLMAEDHGIFAILQGFWISVSKFSKTLIKSKTQ